MESKVDRLNKLREERKAREKARIEKLRDLNLKKYGKNDARPPKSSSTVPITPKTKLDVPSVAPSTSRSDTNAKNASNLKRSITAPKLLLNKGARKSFVTNNINDPNKLNEKSKLGTSVKTVIKEYGDVKNDEDGKKFCVSNNAIINNESTISTPRLNGTKNVNEDKVNNFNSCRRIAFMSKVDAKPKPVDRRKTTIPELRKESNTPTNPKNSVFERLYNSKTKTKLNKQPIDNVTKLKTDLKFLKKFIEDCQIFTGPRPTVFEQQTGIRRSISAIHFKTVHKSELNNCIRKWKSIGDNLNKEDVQDVYEDGSVKDQKVIFQVKSERKRVKSQTPLPLNLNTPKPEELQSTLQNWLKKRGKSLNSYHYLQCFGLHHLSDFNIKPFQAPKFDDADENTENIALEHDGDNESFLEINNRNDKWRTPSSLKNTSDFNESYVTTLTSGEVMHHDELMLGALNDLTELVREGFDREQCARWLRAILERFPYAFDVAPYWECRAAFAQRRGDLVATVKCLELAIAKDREAITWHPKPQVTRKPRKPYRASWH